MGGPTASAATVNSFGFLQNALAKEFAGVGADVGWDVEKKKWGKHEKYMTVKIYKHVIITSMFMVPCCKQQKGTITLKTVH